MSTHKGELRKAQPVTGRSGGYNSAPIRKPTVAEITKAHLTHGIINYY